MSAEFESFKIFYTFEDASTEYKLQKIKFDAETFSTFFNQFQSTVTKMACVGFIGDAKQIANTCGQFLELSTESTEQLFIVLKGSLPDSVTSAISDTEHSEQTESLLLIAKDSRVALVYCHSNPFFNSAPLSQTILAVDYVRYICDNDLANPFQDTVNTAIHLQEHSVKLSETISISRLNDTQSTPFVTLGNCCLSTSNTCQNQLNFTQDHNRLLFIFHMHDETELVNKQIIVSSKDLENSYGDRQIRVQYEDLVKTLKTRWHELDLFDNLTDRARSVLKDFIPNDKHSEFRELLNTIQMRYKSKLRDELLDADRIFAEGMIDRFEKDSCKEHNKQSELTPCSNHCCTVDHIFCSIPDTNAPFDSHGSLKQAFKILSPEHRQIKIHCTRTSKLMTDIRTAWRLHTEKRHKNVTKKLLNIRKLRIDELIDWLNNHAERTITKVRYSLKSTFYEMNPITNIEANVVDFKLITKPFELNKSGTGSAMGSRLSQILFVSDKIGYVNIANLPPKKSSLFYFNFSQISCPEVELSQQLSSPFSKLIVNEKSNIYFIYDNQGHRAERGKLDDRDRRLQSAISVDNLFGKVIEDLEEKDGSPKVLTHIEQACFLYGSESILILDEEFHLIEYRYMSGTMKHVYRRINEDTYIKKVPVCPNDNPSAKYIFIDAIATGKCVLLQCDTSIDIYDLTWTKIGSIPITEPLNFVGFKTFSDHINTYIVLLEKNSNVIVYLLRGLSATRTLDIKRTTPAQIKGFPLLDIFYLAQRKFGPPSESIGCPRKTPITLLLPENFSITSDKLDNYFTQLHTVGMILDIETFTDESNRKSIFPRLPRFDFNDFRRIIATRVPIHIVTIEESNMFPLRDGRNITNDIATWKNSNYHKTGLIDFITESTHFGSYEELLTTCDQPLKVIAIVGRQSGGKSYFLNYVTGTRFNVAATRCTDGIWLSVAFLRGQPIVVLDCEGLFSIRRNDIEEMKLCLTLAAITDILILNQDLSFNRYLVQLFSNFAKGCDRIKGSQLFKGFLMMIIRDVSSQDVEGAYTELISNMRQQAASYRSNYLEKLFGGKIVGHCFHHFENRNFDSEIELARKTIVDLPDRWKTGRAFLESLKLTLAQVHIDDDTMMDIHCLRMAFARLGREAHSMMIQGGKLFSACEKLTIQITKLIDPTVDEEIVIDQNHLCLVDMEDDQDFRSIGSDFSSNEELCKLNKKFCEIIENHFQCPYKEEYHNTWFTNVGQVQTMTLEHRVTFIMSYVDNQLKTYSTYSADINDFEMILRNKLTKFGQSVRLCLRSCHQCRRLCIAKYDHRDDCNCETDHLCKKPCDLCSNSNFCCQRYGHQGNHRCNGGHVCGKQCTVTPICTLFCSLDIGHDHEDQHDCGYRHYCSQICSQQPMCRKNCAFDAQIAHSEHMCDETICPHSCQMPGCSQRCIFSSHAHQRLIDDNNIDSLKLHECTIDYHICGEEHTCPENCIKDGVCLVGYDIIEKNWENPMNTFPYKFYQPKPYRSKCVLPIPLYRLTHDHQRHDCKVDHRCGSQCPECRSFCQLPHGHAEPYHHTNTHRNKECNIFVSKQSENELVKIKTEGKVREYKPGESCKPEICSESCERRGRSHFHLKLCPGLEKCAGKLYPFAKHSDSFWYPKHDQQYDLWLCEEYWHSLGWNVPYNENVLMMVKGCSFFCARTPHDSDTPSFCTKEAWHSGDHVFTCKHTDFDKLDIVFCCDATGSMGSYIEESKKTVRRIMDASKVIKDVKFRFVVYRDHPPQDTSFIVQSNPENLSDAASVIAYINGLSANGGGDGPEAVLDGLFEAVMNTRWRDANTLKYIVHIADAPPHGSLYTNGQGDHWPDGCPCGNTIDNISRAINDRKIRYKLMKIGTYPNTMASVFKEHISDFEEMDLSSALDFSDKCVTILARDLETDEIDVAQ